MQSFRKSVVSSFLCGKGAGYSSSLDTIGLMKAVDTFDSTRRARFSTYASRVSGVPWAYRWPLVVSMTA